MPVKPAPAPTAEREPTVAYRELVDERFQRVWDRFDSVQAAVEKADENLVAYKQTANEFRGTLTDQAQRLVTKDEIKSRDAALEVQRMRIDKIENTASNLQGRIWMLAAIFAIIQVVVNVLQRFIPAASP